MTFIQPNKHSSILNIIIGALAAGVLSAVIVLIMVYNGTVSSARATRGAREEQKQLETENSELKRRVFADFDPVRMAAFAAERGMVSDRQPQYLTINEWVVASQY